MIALFDVELISDNTNDLLEFYHEYISDLVEFEVNENIKQTRSLTSLDSFRDKYLVDTVMIYLVREGYNTETCWGRIEGFNDHRIYVELLEDPKQDFGYEIGQVIYFIVEKMIMTMIYVLLIYHNTWKLLQTNLKMENI